MQRRYLRCLFAAIALPLVAAHPVRTVQAQAANPTYGPSTAYVALGDSYSAGLGGGMPIDRCGRSGEGYPTLWARTHGITSFVDAACSGAVGGDVLRSQLSGLNAHTTVVTLTIGGNDVQLGDQVSSCITHNDQGCASIMDAFHTALSGHMVTIDQVYAAVRAAARNAQVYVLGYPHLYDASAPCAGPLVPSQADRKALNDAVDALDAAIADRSTRAGFHFVDVRKTFAGHGACSAVPWLHPAASLPAPLHPTADGYRYGYFAALQSVTG
jgi:lysophospholipase L1-like esterase